MLARPVSTKMPVIVVQICNPTNTGGIGRRISAQDPRQTQEPYMKDKESKRIWRLGLSDRTPA
jgi:hypothetical protein